MRKLRSASPSMLPFMPSVTGALTMVALLCLGFWSLYRPIVMTGFAKIPGDLGDARLVHLFLEHNYQYFFTSSSDAFWSPSWIFYPLPNGLAMSEVMTGSAWIYSGFRLASVEPYLAYQLWFLTCSGLNFFAFLWLLRHWQLPMLAAATAAYVYAFGLIRVSYVNHPQLVATFYTPLLFLCLDLCFRATQRTKQTAFICLSATCLALQFWSCFYLGWFDAVVILVALAIWCADGARRREVLPFLRLRWQGLAAALALFLALVGPMAAKYLQVAATAGPRQWVRDVGAYLPHLVDLVMPQPDSVLYGRFFPAFINRFGGLGSFSERIEFIGFVLLIAPFALLLVLRKQRESVAALPGMSERSVRLVVYLWFGLTLLSMKFPGSNSLWALCFYLLPGGRAIRAVGRIVHVSMVFQLASFAILMAILSTVKKPWAKVVGIGLCAAVIAENIALTNYGYDVAEQRAHIDQLVAEVAGHTPKCDAFFLSAKGESYIVNVDAMWVSLRTHVPTVNGYTSFIPSQMAMLGIDHPADLTTNVLNAWQRQNGLGDKLICLIK